MVQYKLSGEWVNKISPYDVLKLYEFEVTDEVLEKYLYCPHQFDSDEEDNDSSYSEEINAEFMRRDEIFSSEEARDSSESQTSTGSKDSENDISRTPSPLPQSTEPVISEAQQAMNNMLNNYGIPRQVKLPMPVKQKAEPKKSNNKKETKVMKKKREYDDFDKLLDQYKEKDKKIPVRKSPDVKPQESADKKSNSKKGSLMAKFREKREANRQNSMEVTLKKLTTQYNSAENNRSSTNTPPFDSNSSSQDVPLGIRNASNIKITAKRHPKTNSDNGFVWNGISYPTKTEYLLAKYEKYVSSGKMSLDRAITLAYRECELDEDELNFMDDDESKDRLTEETLVAMNYKSKGLEPTITPAVIDYCMKSDDFFSGILSVREAEKNPIYRDRPNPEWQSMCKIVHQQFSKNIEFTDAEQFNTPELYYRETLRSYLAEEAVKTIIHIRNKGMFNLFKPEEDPMVLSVFQKSIADLFPIPQIVMPLKKLISNGFIPSKIEEFYPCGKKPMAYLLFWSFSMEFNLLGGFSEMENDSEKFDYYWFTFDRRTNEIHQIVESAVEQFIPSSELKIPISDQTLMVSNSSSGNNVVLKNPEAMMNPKFYSQCLDLVNQAAVEYMGVKEKMRTLSEFKASEIADQILTEEGKKYMDVSIEENPNVKDKKSIYIKLKPGRDVDSDELDVKIRNNEIFKDKTINFFVREDKSILENK